MSIGILISVHDGIVLAADSASTLKVVEAGPGLPPNQQTLNVYNNANKIVNLYKGKPIGCVAYGSGSIGSASVSTLLKDFRELLRMKGESFDPANYAMQDVAERLTNFLMGKVNQLGQNEPKPSLGIMVAGYSSQKSLGEGWLLAIENGIEKKPTLLQPEGHVGITWGGEGESTARLVLGFSQELQSVLGQVIQPQLTSDQLEKLTSYLRSRLQAPLVFAPMPIQDAIDLAEWLVHSASMFSRFIPGVPSVGGPIESAAITKHEGFKWIRRKHYYEKSLNSEISDEHRN